MNVIRLIASCFFALVGVYIAAMNFWSVAVNIRNKRKRIEKHHSTVPLVSLVAAGLAFQICPFACKNWVGLIPALDAGNWMLIIGLVSVMIKSLFNGDKKPG